MPKDEAETPKKAAVKAKPAVCGHENVQDGLTCILPAGHEGDHFSDKAVNAFWSDAAGKKDA